MRHAAPALLASWISGAGGGDYARPCALGKLNRIGADISSRAVDQNGLATGGETRLLE